MKKKILTLFISLLFVLPAMAIDLKMARKKGWVKELPTGYIEVVDAKAKDLAAKVNAKRKKHYEGIAKKNGLPIDQVAKQAAEKIKAKLGK